MNQSCYIANILFCANANSSKVPIVYPSSIFACMQHTFNIAVISVYTLELATIPSARSTVCYFFSVDGASEQKWHSAGQIQCDQIINSTPTRHCSPLLCYSLHVLLQPFLLPPRYAPSPSCKPGSSHEQRMH